MSTEILTPVGRLVMGDCFEPQTKDAEGNPLVIKTGANAGQPRVSYYIGLAIPKTDPTFAELHAKIIAEARAGFPTMFDAQGNCINPKFAFKITDGDSVIPNQKNVRPCDKEGHAGHWILNFSDGFAPKCYTAGGAELITDPAVIKRGYYIRVYGNVKANGSTQQAGVYLNHSMVELVGYGEEIVTGMQGDQVFGAAPAAGLPAGASPTPLAPTTAPIQQAPPAPVVPAPDFLAPPPAPVASMRQTPDGGQFTEAALAAAGYTPEMIAALPTV